MLLFDSNIRITDLAKDPSRPLTLVIQKSESSSITAIFQSFHRPKPSHQFSSSCPYPAAQSFQYYDVSHRMVHGKYVRSEGSHIDFSVSLKWQ